MGRALHTVLTIIIWVLRCCYTPSIDKISATRLGQCALFCLEKFSKQHEPANQFTKKPSKTLRNELKKVKPRRLGCTVLLKGSCREELTKVKHVVQYGVFAAYGYVYFKCYLHGIEN